MNPEKGYTYFRNSLNVAIQELTGTDYETYMNLHLADILHLSYRLRYWQLIATLLMTIPYIIMANKINELRLKHKAEIQMIDSYVKEYVRKR